MTPIALLIQRCGLSHREAAAFLGASVTTVNSWATGRRLPPRRAIEALRELYARIEHVADETVRLFNDLGDEPEEIEIGIASDDAEAQSLGWPCVGAQAASIGIAVARLDVPVRVVPRGSTVATAAAADIHE